MILSLFTLLQDVGYQHGKLLFTGWARGDIIENMLRDHRSADYNDSKRTDVRTALSLQMICNMVDVLLNACSPSTFSCQYMMISCLVDLHVSRS